MSVGGAQLGKRLSQGWTVRGGDAGDVEEGRETFPGPRWSCLSRGGDGGSRGWPGREPGRASHHWYRKELRSVKSSRGNWDSSVTQLLKLKASAGPLWLVPKVPVVLLATASRPWKYCQGVGRAGTESPYNTPSGTPGLLLVQTPTPGWPG